MITMGGQKLLLMCLLVVVYLGKRQECEASIINQVKKNVILELDKGWDRLRQFDRAGRNQAELLQEVGKSIASIPLEISRVEKEMLVYEYDEALKSLSKVKNTSISWRDKWSEISVLSSPVDIIYGHFKIFPEMPDAFLPGFGAFDFDANTLANLILKPLYSTDSSAGSITLKYMVENIHSAVITQSRGRNDAFSLLNRHIEESLQQSYWCLWNAKTPQRIVYGLYTATSLIDIKEYTLLNFAWMIRYALNGTLVEKDLTDSKKELETRIGEKSVHAKNALDKASSSYWRCDPIEYKKGENFEEFQELLQGYIENEKNMHHTGSCRQSCGEYNVIKAYCPYPDPESCHHHRICTGNLIDCKFVAADSTVCPANPPRRFDYIQYKKGPTYGNTSGRCGKDTEKRDSFWRFLYHCSNCFCLCDDPDSPTTIRHISLLGDIADVLSNKVVTGVRFVMNDGVLHLQIEEGEPTKEGLVIEESTVWKPVPKANKKDNSETVQLDYTLRSLDLDDLLVPTHHVVTGVRFRTLGTHVNLEVQATQINPESGKLIPSSSHWIGNDNTPETESNVPRDELLLEDPDLPTRTKTPSVPDSVHDQFISFGASSTTKDAAQSTVPYIDIQEVRPKPAVWLKGIGVYHKGQWGYGGFIAPRIFTHSAADYIQVENDGH